MASPANPPQPPSPTPVYAETVVETLTTDPLASPPPRKISNPPARPARPANISIAAVHEAAAVPVSPVLPPPLPQQSGHAPPPPPLPVVASRSPPPPPTTAAVPQRCRQCGAERDGMARFCVECGSAFDG
eukprot:TRINITY_DN5829_c0_g1_i4.p2 TRINITY_DN5829_c0_g1~~TRINITY_DN5829_c0_g1_i4.p2  ORF type:complete len:130 (-),score=12.91 TRINITY_DN5829_c0_g1_i4:26-415(-)